jgi:hypothetical protein
MTSDAKHQLWRDFSRRHGVADRSVALFAASASGEVDTIGYGQDQRRVLRRSPAMEDVLASEAERCLSDAGRSLDGVLYMMLRRDGEGGLTPLYIGKAGRTGRDGGVSANLVNVRQDPGKFARWGGGCK